MRPTPTLQPGQRHGRRQRLLRHRRLQPADERRLQLRGQEQLLDPRTRHRQRPAAPSRRSSRSRSATSTRRRPTSRSAAPAWPRIRPPERRSGPSATDPDAGDTYTFTWSPGRAHRQRLVHDRRLESADGRDLRLRGQVELLDPRPGHRQRRLTFEKQFTITVTNVNEAPTDIALSSTHGRREPACGNRRRHLSTTDPDAGDTFTYTLVAGTGATTTPPSTIVGTSCRRARVFDFEAKSSYSIRVRATDSGGADLREGRSRSPSRNVNEAPTDLRCRTAASPRTRPSGTTVGTLSATDPDAGRHLHLHPGRRHRRDRQRLVQHRRQRAADERRLQLRGQERYSIRVRTDRPRRAAFEKAFTITVTNVNEAPTDLALSRDASRRTRPPGPTVGTLIDDRPGRRQHAHLHPGRRHRLDRQRVVHDRRHHETAARFDFETEVTYSIRVRTTDRGGLTSKGLHHHVTNVNETPTDIALSNGGVAENQAGGNAVGTLSTTDPDAGDTFTYTLVPARHDDNGSFTITGTRRRTPLRLRGQVELLGPGPDDRPAAADLRQGVHHHRHQRQRGAGEHGPERADGERGHRPELHRAQRRRCRTRARATSRRPSPR